MVRTLLTALFPKETLLTSNYKGGKSTINPRQSRRTKLDPVIMAAIKGKTIFKNEGKKMKQLIVF